MEDEKSDGSEVGATTPARTPETEPPGPATPEADSTVSRAPETEPLVAAIPDTAPPAVAAPDTRPVPGPGRDRSPAPRAERSRAARPDILELREPLYREAGGYRLRLDPPDLARLRELPGSREKTDRELGEQFFDANSERLTGAVADDVPAPAELRVVVDPFSRQAFLALGRTIRGIVSF